MVKVVKFVIVSIIILDETLDNALVKCLHYNSCHFYQRKVLGNKGNLGEKPFQCIRVVFELGPILPNF